MPKYELPGRGTLVIVALLLVAIAFAGSWIIAYADPARNPWSILPWYGMAAAIIIIVGIITAVFPRRRRNGS